MIQGPESDNSNSLSASGEDSMYTFVGPGPQGVGASRGTGVDLAAVFPDDDGGLSLGLGSRGKGPALGGMGSDYLKVGLEKGLVSFSLQAVVEISRLNAFRMSAIWQMVTSHLRMIA